MAGSPEKLTGLILQAAPCREYDRRLVILTRERGKITAFARGARRQGNTLMGAAYPFSYGIFSAYEGKDAYSLIGADIQNSFSVLKADLLLTCYASYFAEMTAYFTREGPDEGAMMKLLYVTFLALEKKRFPEKMIRFVFETKALILNGAYPMELFERSNIPPIVRYTVNFLKECPPQKVFTFTLDEEGLDKCLRFQKNVMDHIPGLRLKSLEMLELMED